MFQLSKDVIIDCAQLVKANSITGNKMNDVDVVYTMWNNLKKTADMDVGQIGFHSNKAVKKIRPNAPPDYNQECRSMLFTGNASRCSEFMLVSDA